MKGAWYVCAQRAMKKTRGTNCGKMHIVSGFLSDKEL